jgi:hypothetical protein
VSNSLGRSVTGSSVNCGGHCYVVGVTVNSPAVGATVRTANRGGISRYFSFERYRLGRSVTESSVNCGGHCYVVGVTVNCPAVGATVRTVNRGGISR